MKIKERTIKGVFEIQLEPRIDERGFFMRTYDDKILSQYNIHKNWVQENQSLSIPKGVIRGLHFQFPPHAETKFVRVIAGRLLDVFVDLRKNSSTFGQWDSIVLSAENKKAIYIPAGFAHGICTMSENVEVVYKVDSYYAPAHEGALRWNDPDLNIPWPVGDPILSEKDRNAETLRQFVEAHSGLAVAGTLRL